MLIETPPKKGNDEKISSDVSNNYLWGVCRMDLSPFMFSCKEGSMLPHGNDKPSMPEIPLPDWEDNLPSNHWQSRRHISLPGTKLSRRNCRREEWVFEATILPPTIPMETPSSPFCPPNNTFRPIDMAKNHPDEGHNQCPKNNGDSLSPPPPPLRMMGGPHEDSTSVRYLTFDPKYGNYLSSFPLPPREVGGPESIASVHYLTFEADSDERNDYHHHLLLTDLDDDEDYDNHNMVARANNVASSTTNKIKMRTTSNPVLIQFASSHSVL